MQASLYANITSLQLTETLGGSAFSFPKLVAGKQLTLKLRPAQRIEGSNESADQRQIHAIKASIGKVDTPPTTGTYQLKIGSGAESSANVTGDIAYNATTAQMKAAIDALTSLSGSGVTCAVTLIEGTYTIRFSDGLERSITCVDNALWPLSFVTVNSHIFDEVFVHDLRLMQSMVASTSLFTLVNAPVPTVTEIVTGATNSDILTAEIQKLAIPTEFNAGSFLLTRGFKKTAPIGLPTTADEIQTALAAIADEDGTFAVTEQQDAVLIEFGGSMSGTDQALLGVTVLEGPAPSAFLTIDTNTAAMASVMRVVDQQGEVKLPLEIELQLVDEEDSELYHPYAWRTELTFVRPVNLEDRNVAVDVNWNQPLARHNYLAWSPDQLVIGQRAYAVAIGNGTANPITVNHNLNREVLHVTIRENIAGGERLPESEYTVVFTNNNSLQVTFASAPTAAQYLIAISTADQPATFLAHTHEIDEVNGLEERLAALEAAVAALQTHAPSGTFSTDTASTAPLMTWPLEQYIELYPRRGALEKGLAGTEGSIRDLPAELLNRNGGLLPAVHDATTENLVVPLEFDDANKAKVFENNTGGIVKLPGRLGRKGVDLASGEHCAYDGVGWYRVDRYDVTKTSWYPTDFTRELFSLAITEEMFPVGHTLKIDIGFEVMIHQAKVGSFQQLTNDPKRSTARWKLVFERGEITQDASPSTTDTNIDDIVWAVDEPLLTQDLLINHVATAHYFGISILRASGGMTAKKRAYSTSAAAENAAPDGFPFAIRARLVGFDTQNSVLDPRGIIALAGLNRDGNGVNADRGKAVIIKT